MAVGSIDGLGTWWY